MDYELLKLKAKLRINLLVGIVASILLLLAFTAYFIFSTLAFDPFQTVHLSLKAALSPDKILFEVKCNEDYSWRVASKDVVVPGNKLELGTDSEIYPRNHLFLMRGNIEIPIFIESASYDLPTHQNISSGWILQDIPNTGPEFLGVPIKLRSYVYVDERDITDANTREIAECIFRNLNALETTLYPDNPKQYLHALLTVPSLEESLPLYAKEDRSIKKGSRSSNALEFVCSDGKVAEVSGATIRKTNDRVGSVNQDGSVIWLSSVDVSQCKDNDNVNVHTYFERLKSNIVLLYK